jgi:ADP-ribose pyrophosphatase
MADSPETESNSVVPHWEELDSKPIANCRIFDVMSKRFRHPKRGTEGDFYVIETRDWVNVLAITEDYRIVLVNQFRFGVKETSWEIPGGVMEVGEEPISAGLRELREETGYTPGKARLLGSVRPNPAIQSNVCHIVLAEETRLTDELEWDEHEEIVTRAFPIEEVYEMAQRGEIFHSLVLNALLLYYPQWQTLQKRRRR